VISSGNYLRRKEENKLITNTNQKFFIMETKTLRILVIALFAAIVTLGISSCSGDGQQNRDQGSQPVQGQAHEAEAGEIQLAEFHVNGNCSMCKNRIEDAAMKVAGVESANWNVETKTATVGFDDSRTGLDKIHAAIAAAGHDTEMNRATDEAYNNLHTCCKYERN
jgi:periplasmic mercuric ion binding protein